MALTRWQCAKAVWTLPGLLWTTFARVRQTQAAQAKGLGLSVATFASLARTASPLHSPPHGRYVSSSHPEPKPFNETWIGARPALPRKERHQAIVLDATKQFEQGEFAKVKELLSGLPSNDRGVAGWFLLGRAYMLLDSAEEAIHCFDEALALDPAYAPCFLKRGECRASLGDLRGGEDDLTVFLGHNDKVAEAFLLRAELRSGIDELPKALKDYKRALRINPTLIRAFIGAAKLHLLGGDWEECQALLDRGLQIDSQNPFLRSTLAVLLQQKGMWQDSLYPFNEAIRFIEQRGEADPGTGLPMSILLGTTVAQRAATHLHLGNLDEALEDSERAYKLLQYTAQRHYPLLTRGEVHYLKGNLVDAIQDWTTFLNVEERNTVRAHNPLEGGQHARAHDDQKASILMQRSLAHRALGLETKDPTMLGKAVRDARQAVILHPDCPDEWKEIRSQMEAAYRQATEWK